MNTVGQASATPTEADRETSRFRFGWRAVFLNFVFWTFFAVLTTTNRLLHPFNPSGESRRVLAETTYWFFDAYLWAIATPLIFWLAWRFSGVRSSWPGRIPLLLGAGLVVAMFMHVAGDVVWGEVLKFPRRGAGGSSALNEITRPWMLMLRPWFLNDLTTYAGILAAGFAREYFLRYRVHEQEAVRLQAHSAQLQAQLAEARLEVLRTQLNPHFLFNTLNAVSALVAKDPKGVRRMISRLSELLRFGLDGTRQQEIPLHEELKLLRNYLEILEIRFQGRLETSIESAPELEDALVPNLILQPLAENAMKHGIARAGGHGRISVQARRAGERLVLSVVDTGPGEREPGESDSSMERSGAGIGLRHTRTRLEELYGPDGRFALRPTPEGGMVAEVTLPFHTAHVAAPAQRELVHA